MCYTDTDIFIIHIKTEDFYKTVKHDVEKRFHTSPYEIERPLPIGKNKKVISMINDKLGVGGGGWGILKQLIGLRLKMYSYKKDNDK